MAADFGRIKQVHLDGTTVDVEFFNPGVVVKTLPVNRLKTKLVDSSLVEKMESIRKNFAELLMPEVEKGIELSAHYLLKNYPNIVDFQSSYNGRNCSALSVACQNGNYGMVKLLLQHKASVNAEDAEETGNRPIHHTVLRYCVHI